MRRIFWNNIRRSIQNKMSVVFEVAVQFREDGMTIGRTFEMMAPIFGVDRTLEGIIATFGFSQDRQRDLIQWLQEEPGESQMPDLDDLLEADLPPSDDEDVQEALDVSFEEQEVPIRPANVTLPKATSQTKAGKCMICLDDTLTSPVDLNCGHSFCHACIKTWFSTHDSCPCCRQISKPVVAPTKRRRRRRVQRKPRAGRRRPRCRRCGNLRTGHSRNICVGNTVQV